MKKTKWIWIWAAIGLVLGIIIFWPSNRGNKEAILEASAVEEVVDTTEQQQIHYKYGIPDENFIIEEGIVGKNENLSLILSKYKVSPAKIHEISQRCKDIFDVRSIRRGQNYTLFLAQDSLRTPEFFIYEKNALEYVVIDFKETADVYVGKKDIVTKEKTANIIINSNLWNAMVDAQTDPMLAVTLSDIYAWSIDFYGIAKGDSVRVLYEQSYVEDKPLQDFNVKAAIFTNSGKDFYAIPFEQNEKLAYFDEEGKYDETKQRPMIALTFDDGPGEYTEELINCLVENNAKATFFMLGQNVEAYPEIAKELSDAGMELGNHSYSHPDLVTIGAEAAAQQVSNTDAALKAATGFEATVMRPPGGSFNDSVKAAIDHPLIIWSIDTRDWATKSEDQTYQVVMDNAQDGSVVLMHDIHEWSVKAAIRMIPDLIAKGFKLVTVSELAEAKGKTLQSGNAYYYFGEGEQQVE